MACRWIAAILLVFVDPQGVVAAYYGVPIGPVTMIAHGFTGKMFAATEKSIYITEMNYDGQGPSAFFWGGFAPTLSKNGDQLPDEHGSNAVLKAYANANVYLKLPKKITDYKAIGILCTSADADFGNVRIPDNFVLPKEQSLGQLAAKKPNTMATEVILKDSATMLIKGLDYDGSCAGSAFFVAAADANTPAANMTKLAYDNGKTTKLERYTKADVTVTLPADHHWDEFGWFSVYCMDTKESHADIAIAKPVAQSLPVFMAPSKDPPPQSNPAGDSNKPKDNPAGDSNKPKDDAGTLSALSVVTLSIGALLTALAVRRCFEGGQRAKTS
ncbi:protein Skeletor, isoforms B/C-like [Dermacentor andersoni]|uniref:protein Skeletor, isoforms B/C-like n=1 Tax=Dermacentor andersoni TaxID=34620 RepID=UPI0024180F93|nr:protein Skeletor, isoforms B/C-like [Dermacentor andersoni]